jgi:hypothetical protein
MISRIKFRNDVSKYWTDLSDYVAAYTALTGTGVDPSQAQANILRVAPKFGELVKLLYGPLVAYDVTSYIQGMISGLFEAVALIENNVETTELTNRVASNVIANLTQQLNSLNSDWQTSVTVPIFTAIWTAWLDQAKNKLENNTEGYLNAKILASNNCLAFAEAFSDSAIKQFGSIFY